MSKRTLCVVILLPLSSLAIGALPMRAQTVSFYRPFTTPAIDYAAAVAADASGIYVMGNKWGALPGESSAGIRKYDSLGNELWTREIRATTGRSITVLSA